MVWPFTSNKGKETSELTKELPENLKGFFEENNPDSKHQSIFEESPHQKRVNQVLLKHQKQNTPYSYELERYKQKEKPQVVTAVNCAEIQQQVVDCFRSFNLTSTTQCKFEIGKTTACVEIQNRALKKLYYEDCVDIDQCEKIRYIVDKLFTENFGQYGDEVNEVTKANFDKSLDGMFYKVWK
ncbi:uncharacterized protein CANTADRAFT_50860 [Suhomyces tanzawaensis NRRL Y-17324]|uniref:Uncharacterized protein n=1 Tax=Suhomyces tanzawaensis NRRL Y-17324 TaxID=984487 RepID=A0A1E4SIP9_9ASCO|nr:uncharacterized protein CANTADRAFT_50860 [Suhomyces tanzawaensis NRRL Y-17324]ODV79317.1 hypothetical protein CANTADRAFT_50860 [Suhomyces tanzawaensis NRRL Y-17324]